MRSLRRNSAASVPRVGCWKRIPNWKENVVWSPGYFVSTVGVEEARILAYVKWQERQDSGQAQLELF